MRDKNAEWISAKDSIPCGDEVACLVIVSGNPQPNITLDHAFELADFYMTASGGEWSLEMWPEWENPTIHFFMPIEHLPAAKEDL